MFTKEGLGFWGEQTVKKILDAYQGISIWGVVLFFVLAVVITILLSYTHSNKKLRRKNDELIKARSANEEKSRFLFNMSHDLRTPMNSILGFSQIARNNINDAEKVEDCLKKIESSGQHLLRLINDVLDMAKIENGKMDYRDEPTDIRERISELNDIMEEEVKKKELEYVSVLDIQESYIFSDPMRMRQISLNLLSNAIKYTNPGGKISYSITQIPCKKEGYARYRFCVTDTGIGMSQEFQEHIFEVFEREKNTTTSGVQGTGLGMAITKRIVDALGGTIQVRSRQGEGTSIEIFIEFRIDTQKQAKRILEEKERQRQAKTRKDYEGKRLLLVEDNALNAEIAKELLGEFGFEIITAEDGCIAVEKVKKETENYFDIILMDIQMPNMDGYSATKEIRALKSSKKAEIPIIAMTANAFAEDKRRAKESGMDEFISKPFDVNEVIKIFERFLQGK